MIQTDTNIKFYTKKKNESKLTIILPLIILCFLVSNVFGQEPPAGYDKINEQDSLALVAYYHSTNGDDWLDKSGWLTDAPLYSWIGITEVANVAGDGEIPDWRVVNIEIPRNNMTVPGPIPPEIGDLEYLENFEADVNLQIGELPVELANLDRLQFVLLRNNLLTGEIDWDAFGEMPVLEQFRLRANFFSGSLPTVLGANGSWSSLRRFYMDGNRFTGQIPQVDPSLTTLNRVYLNNLQLTGPIPDWSSLEGMEYYRIANNNLDSGPIPGWIFEAWSETLIRFQIQNTNRTGSIPQEFTQLEALEQFIIGGVADDIGEGETTDDIPDMSVMPSLRIISINGGKWTGSLPSWIGDVFALEEVQFSNLALTGTIPANFADAEGLVSIHLEDLQIEGGIPDQFQLATGLEEITLIDNPNMTVGTIPSWIGSTLGSLTQLRLANVGVTGQIPQNLRNLPIEALNLRDNPGLTGNFPTDLESKNFSELELSRTGLQFDGVPSWLSTKNNLSYLGLAGLGLEGEIPSFLGEGLRAVNMTDIALNDNNLTGEIPASLGDIIRLDSLNLSNNNLSGSIPANLVNAGRVTDNLNVLTALLFSGNENLSGPIPIGFTDASFMRVFEYENTNLCEPDGDAFENWLTGIPEYAAESYPIAYYSIKRTNVKCSEVAIEEDAVPGRFTLSQNYPNPFNPSTSISYQIPNSSVVTLKVFNLLGQEVAVLVNETKPAGSYEVKFDASQLTSGVYFYRLEAAGKTATHRMMLIK